MGSPSENCMQKIRIIILFVFHPREDLQNSCNKKCEKESLSKIEFIVYSFLVESADQFLSYEYFAFVCERQISKYPLCT